MPDRTEVNSAIVRCRTRVVPLRTVNKKLRERAPPQSSWIVLPAAARISSSRATNASLAWIASEIEAQPFRIKVIGGSAQRSIRLGGNAGPSRE